MISANLKHDNESGFGPYDSLHKNHLLRCQRFYGAATVPRLRTVQEFAEQEIIIPNGPKEGQLYDTSFKPASRLWFAELDKRCWRIYVYTGPTQSGKTLDAFIIPILYCLFERREDVIVGVPDFNMSEKKWNKDILPALLKTKYGALLPKSGAGSRGGDSLNYKFTNGTWLSFMSFGSDDKGKAGDTAPNIIVTETDGANDVSSTSDEGTAIDQIKARADAYDDDAFIILECTVSRDDGITWQEFTNGTRTEIVLPCPYCFEWVLPERQHFIGWESAANVVEARQKGRFHCPKCQTAWTDADRTAANAMAKMLHKGQTIGTDGDISNKPPAVDTFGFRLSAVHNPFRSSENLAARMYRAERSAKPEIAKRTILQSQFAEPVTDSDDEYPQIDAAAAVGRFGPVEYRTPPGVVPRDYDVVTIGADLRATQLHWVATAFQNDATNRIINYGILKVHSRRLGLEKGIQKALTYLRDNVIKPGFMSETGKRFAVSQTFLDAGYQGEKTKFTVYEFVRSCLQNPLFEKRVWAYLGRGKQMQYGGRYSPIEKATGDVLYAGWNFYLKWLDAHRLPVFFINADYYKSFAHDRFRTPIVYDDSHETPGELVPGAATLFLPNAEDHTVFINHICAEREIPRFDDKRGGYSEWIVESRVNHFLDAYYASCCAAVYDGVRTAEMLDFIPDQSHDNETLDFYQDSAGDGYAQNDDGFDDGFESPFYS